LRGARDLSKPRIGYIDLYWPPAEKAQPMRMPFWPAPLFGSRETVRAGIDPSSWKPPPTKLMVFSDAQAARLRSFELIGQARQKPSP